MPVIVTYLSKLPDISNILSLQATEIGRDATVLEVHDDGERFVEERSYGCDGKPRAMAATVSIIALKPMSTLPEPMISVTSVHGS